MDRNLEFAKLIFGFFWYLLTIYFYEHFIYENWKRIMRDASSVRKLKESMSEIHDKYDFLIFKYRLAHLIKKSRNIKWKKVKFMMVHIANLFFFSTTFKIFSIENLLFSDSSFSYAKENSDSKSITSDYIICLLQSNFPLVIGISTALVLNRLRKPIHRKIFYFSIAILLCSSFLLNFVLDTNDIRNFSFNEVQSNQTKILAKIANESNLINAEKITNNSTQIENSTNIWVDNNNFTNMTSMPINFTNSSITEKNNTLPSFWENSIEVFSDRELLVRRTVFSMILLILIFFLNFFYPTIVTNILALLALIVIIEFIRFLINAVYKGAGDTLLGLIIGVMIENMVNS